MNNGGICFRIRQSQIDICKSLSNKGSRTNARDCGINKLYIIGGDGTQRAASVTFEELKGACGSLVLDNSASKCDVSFVYFIKFLVVRAIYVAVFCIVMTSDQNAITLSKIGGTSLVAFFNNIELKLL
ncbi:6-phosphofructokinase [Trifolium repens]|nr:6-phosphofructokinase [Trifolium repens]